MAKWRLKADHREVIDVVDMAEGWVGTEYAGGCQTRSFFSLPNPWLCEFFEPVPEEPKLEVRLLAFATMHRAEMGTHWSDLLHDCAQEMRRLRAKAGE